jgi:transcriptional regulator with XRE-family HTH domain
LSQSIVTSQYQNLTIKNESRGKSVEVGALEPFLDKEYRDEYLDGYVKGSIALQVRALREKAGLSQKQFGEEIDKPQSVVSRLEDTEYGAVNVNTLLDIAKALNVGLQVGFVDYIRVLSADVSPAAMKVENVYETYQRCTVVTQVSVESVSRISFNLYNPAISITINRTGTPSVTANSISRGTSWQNQPKQQELLLPFREGETLSTGKSTQT